MSSLLNVLRPLMLTSRMLGLWPFTLRPSLTLSLPWLLYSCVLAGGVSCCAAWLAYRREVTTPIRKTIGNRLSDLTFVIDNVVQILCWCLAFSTFLLVGRRRVVRLVDVLLALGQQVDRRPVDWRGLRFGLWVQVGMSVLVPTVSMGMPMLSVLRRPHWGLSGLTMAVFYVGHTMAAILEGQFLVLVRALQVLLAGLNARLRRQHEHLSSQNCVWTTAPSQLRQLHLDITEAAAVAANAYAFPILAGLLSSCVQIVTVSYMVMDWTKEDDPHLVAGHICMISGMAAKIVQLVIVCEMAYAEERVTVFEVCRLLNISSSLSSLDRSEYQILSVQMLHRKMCFSAWGLFQIDSHLLTSIATVVITYLVILVQFQF